MAQDSARQEAILAMLEAEKVRFVNLEFTDVVGMAKCVTIPVEQFPDCLEHGKWFDGSALEGFARVAESDMYLLPDLSTFAVLSVKVRPQGQRSRLDTGDHHQVPEDDEVAGGQHELDFVMRDALHVADALMTAKYVLKAIAAQHGLYATFLPKPFFGVNGSGMHTHQQLILRGTHQNAFVDEHGEFGLSDIGRYFIAGQLAHASAMCAILAPLVNSYKRLVSGYEAPVYINWGRINREALIRVPRPGEDRHATARIELRSCDPSCNPYLALP